ncbi:MAG: hypothetical protein ABSG21_16200, partial [Spirochaetia bacterium]
MSAVDLSSLSNASEDPVFKSPPVFSLPEWTRSNDLATLESNCKSLDEKATEDTISVGCGLANIIDKCLWRQAGIPSKRRYMQDCKLRLNMSKQRVSELIKIGRAYLKYSLVWYELEFHEPPFKFEGNLHKLLHVEEAMKNHPSWEVKEHLVSDNKEQFVAFAKGEKTSAQLDKVRRPSKNQTKDAQPVEPGPLPPRDDVNRTTLAFAFKNRLLVRLICARTQDKATQFRSRYREFVRQYLEEQVHAVDRKVMAIQNGMSLSGFDHLDEHEALVKIGNSNLAKTTLILSVVFARIFDVEGLRDQACKGGRRSPEKYLMETFDVSRPTVFQRKRIGRAYLKFHEQLLDYDFDPCRGIYNLEYLPRAVKNHPDTPDEPFERLQRMSCNDYELWSKNISPADPVQYDPDARMPTTR